MRPVCALVAGAAPVDESTEEVPRDAPVQATVQR
jgi:hypothetical protein